jgi:ribosomal protein S18 acetylase RimI-like enzyme/predicted RNA-binding protein with PIN domain
MGRSPRGADGPLDLRTVERLYVDVMNVVGSRPDGWWRDRAGAIRRLVDELRPLADGTGARVVAVVDGRPVDGLPEGELRGVAVRYATRRGPDAADDRLVELLADDPPTAAKRPTLVVTSDRALRERVTALGAQVRGPSGLLDVLDGVRSVRPTRTERATRLDEVDLPIHVTIAAEDRWRQVRSLRLAALADAPDTFWATLEEEVDQPPSFWTGRLSDERGCTLVAEVPVGPGVPVGGGLAVLAPAWERPGAAGLYSVWVAPWARGAGVADRLVEVAVEVARERGHQQLALEVGDHNARAIHLYERHGFEPTGRRTALPPPRDHLTEHELLLDLTAR